MDAPLTIMLIIFYHDTFDFEHTVSTVSLIHKTWKFWGKIFHHDKSYLVCIKVAPITLQKINYIPFLVLLIFLTD